MKVRNRLKVAARQFVADDEADDLLQDAFVRLWSRGLNSDVSEGMLFVTVRNLAIDSVRRDKIRTEVSLTQEVKDEDWAEDEATEPEAVYHEVDTLISKHLTPRDREILLHRERDGWEFSELAEATGLTEANVRMIVARARRTIREAYRKRQNI